MGQYGKYEVNDAEDLSLPGGFIANFGRMLKMRVRNLNRVNGFKKLVDNIDLSEGLAPC